MNKELRITLSNEDLLQFGRVSVKDNLAVISSRTSYYGDLPLKSEDGGHTGCSRRGSNSDG